jgi:PAS domain S-box-containing protein
MGVRSPALQSFGDAFAWSLLDAAPDAMLIVSVTGEIVFANDHAGELFGREARDLLGRPVEDLLPEPSRSVHRAHRTRYQAEPVVRAMGAGLELHALRADGSEMPVEVSLSPLRLDDEDLVVAAVRDITDRVSAEEQMHRVIRTLDATDDGVLIFDAATLRYSFVNEGACRLVGYDHEELLAMTPLHLNPYTTEAEYRRMVDGLLDGTEEAVFRRSTLLRKDGREVPVEKTLRSAPMGRDGTAWVITLVRDISARLAAEAELRASQDALQEAERAVAVSEDRERIARDLHDTVIQRLFAEGLNLQAALGVLADPERSRPRIEATIEALDSTIKDLRTAIFALQTSSESAHGGLRRRLLDVVTDASPSLGFEPRVQFEGAVDSVDEAIADALVPVLREALSNVAHHAGARHVRVSVVAGADVVLTVSDDGRGLPDGVLEGHGIESLETRARRLGGRLDVASREGGGTDLVWRVPRDVDASHTTDAPW